MRSAAERVPNLGQDSLPSLPARDDACRDDEALADERFPLPLGEPAPPSIPLWRARRGGGARGSQGGAIRARGGAKGLTSQGCGAMSASAEGQP